MNKSGKNVLKLAIYTLAILVISSCASQRYAKLALKNEQAGLYEDAAELYLKSLLADKENINAKVGAKKNGQLALDNKLGKFSKAYATGDSRNAVYIYLNAKDFSQKFSDSGVKLDFPDAYNEQYNEVKLILVEEKYKQGIRLLNEEKFSECEPIFKEILNLENGYKDVKELWKTSHYEPLYRQGKAYFDNKFYRKAYYNFNTIVKETGEYKEAVQLKQDALNAGAFPISVYQFESYNSSPAFGYKLRSLIVSMLINSGNPFLKIIDKQNSQNNQNAILGGINNGTQIQLGKEYGIKAVLIGKVINYRTTSGNLIRNEMKGYYKVAKTAVENGQTVTNYEYQKIIYNEFSQQNTVTCTFKYQLTSTETDAILVTDEMTLTKNDLVHFAVYDGDYRNVVPGYWTSNPQKAAENVVNTNYNDIYNLQSLFKANRNIKTTDRLSEELSNEISRSISDKIINFNPEN